MKFYMVHLSMLGMGMAITGVLYTMNMELFAIKTGVGSSLIIVDILKKSYKEFNYEN